jgi:general secretion pathway protein M
MSAWWEARSARERVLVGTMLALAAMLLAWLLIVRPLADALDSARMRHGDAATALALARARAQPPATSAPAAAGPIEAIIVRTAGAAGFPAARIASQSRGRASVTLDSARSQALFGWVAQMEQQGLVVEGLRVRANDDHTLSAEMILGARR